MRGPKRIPVEYLNEDDTRQLRLHEARTGVSLNRDDSEISLVERSGEFFVRRQWADGTVLEAGFGEVASALIRSMTETHH